MFIVEEIKVYVLRCLTLISGQYTCNVPNSILPVHKQSNDAIVVASCHKRTANATMFENWCLGNIYIVVYLI